VAEVGIPAQAAAMGPDRVLAPKILVVVGLGNPGEQYAGTRHNAGFQVVDELARRRRVCWRPTHASFVYTREKLPGSGPVLVKPLTFMNRSGIAIDEMMRQFQLSSNQILVVHDDLDLAVGRLRLMARGSAGGHRGVQSIIEHTATDAFARIKVGIGRPRHSEPIEEYVLEPPYADELELYQATIERAATAAEAVLTGGLEAAMNRFNSRWQPFQEGPGGTVKDAQA